MNGGRGQAVGSRSKIGGDRFASLGMLLLSLLLLALAGGTARAETAVGPGSAAPGGHVLEEKKELLEQLDEIDKELDLVTGQWEKLNADLKRVQTRRRRLSSQLAATRKELRLVREKARTRLIALYKFSTMDYLLPLTRVHDFHTAMHAVYAITRLIERDHALFTRLRQKQEQVRVLRASLGEYEWQSRELERQLQKQVERLVRSKEAKIRLLIEMDHAESQRMRRSAFEDTGKSTPGPVSQQSPAPPAFGLFARHKGRVPLPVAGKITITYGRKKHSPYRSILYNNGVLIRTERNEPVRAVFAGRVVFANWFRGYGNIMIIDHGHHYYTLLAHLSSMYKKAGDPVRGGEVVATTGPSSTPGEGELYFEIRYHKRPLDPSQWLAANK